MGFQAMGSIVRGGRQALRAIAMLGFLAFGVTAASADACAVLKARYAGATGELRQIDGAVRAIRSAGRDCESGWRDGGFFDPCRQRADRLAQRYQAVVRAHQAVSAQRTAVRAQLASYGCLDQARRVVRPRRQAIVESQPAARPAAGQAMLYCVRPSDGYFFPAPNAQFVGMEAADETRDRCRFICEDTAMDVYVLDDVAAGTEAMVSVSGRKPYAELASAHAYREKAGFRRCDMQRYHDRIDEARARVATPANLGDVPLPSASPRAAPGDLMLAFRGSLSDYEMPQSNVRMVGSAYFPD